MTDSENAQKHTGSAHCDCGCMGAGPLFSRVLHMFDPPAAADQHFKQARIEFLKGLRSLLDHRIESLSHGPVKGTRITVE
jgi:hypothetical protein